VGRGVPLTAVLTCGTAVWRPSTVRKALASGLAAAEISAFEEPADAVGVAAEAVADREAEAVRDVFGAADEACAIPGTAHATASATAIPPDNSR
jgi:hypothetical protein